MCRKAADWDQAEMDEQSALEQFFRVSELNVSQQLDVQHWLEERISELADDLEPQPLKCYSAYELSRQRSVVANCRVLLQMAQHELQHVPAGCSSAHVAHLKKECEKAEAEVSEAVRELELIVKWCEDNNVM